jgi:hypothetical protein
VPPEELLASLKLTLEERPDLWHAHKRHDPATGGDGPARRGEQLADAAVEKFPAAPQALARSALRSAARAPIAPGDIASLEKCMQITPGWGYAARELSGAYERYGQREKGNCPARTGQGPRAAGRLQLRLPGRPCCFQPIARTRR